jgi:pimeloyl-ACP methyl ester carboxylesterase
MRALTLTPIRSTFSVGAAFSALLLAASCTENVPSPTATNSDAGAVAPLAEPSFPCGDRIDDVYGNPGALASDPAARGNIVKCVKEADISKDAMQAKLTELAAPAAPGKPLTSAARVYRISYRTERGDTASTPSVSSAIVYAPVTPRASKLPVVVVGRGSRGQAAKCAVSKFDPALDGINGDAWRMIYPLVGYGYAVIVPDLAGYANAGTPGNPPSAYAQSSDVAKSTLDGARALKKLFPALDEKVVLVGHSQGGHSALSALALAGSYGTSGPIVGAAVYAPLWLSQRSWGGVLISSIGKNYPLATSSIGNVSVWYHYTQAELLDGPGEGKKLFAADKQAAVEAFVNGECWGSTELSKHAQFAHELFDPSFVQEISLPAATGGDCSSERCTKWIARYKADRPQLVGDAAKVPILLTYGTKDTTIPPERMRCALDRLKQDGANLTACVDKDLSHSEIVSARGEHVASWIASLTLGEPAPPACAANESAIEAACATPPPND